MRRTRQALWLAVMAASVLLAQPVQAQQKAVQPRQPETSQPVGVYARRHALCIGVNDYESPAIPDLSYAEADARKVANVLRTVYGFDDVTVISIAGSKQLSQESEKWGGGHGVFTWALLEGLKGDADGFGGVAKDGIVTLGEIMDYVDQAVRRETKNEQRPSRTGSRYDRNLPMGVVR